MLIIFSTLYLPSQLSTMMVEVDSIQCVVQYISNNNHYNNDSFLFIPCENKQGSEYICSMQYTCNSVYVIVQQCIYVQCQYVYVQSIQNQFNIVRKNKHFSPYYLSSCTRKGYVPIKTNNITLSVYLCCDVNVCCVCINLLYIWIIHTHTFIKIYLLLLL